MNPLALLGRLPMYRVVTLALAAIVVHALILAALQEFIEPLVLRYLLPSLAICVVVSLIVNVVCARIVRRGAHHESALITALIVFLLFWPPDTALGYVWLVLALVIAQVSKYLVVWRGRHLLNPAAAGAFAAAAVQYAAGIPPEDTLMASWWVASAALFWTILIGGTLVAVRTQKVGPAALLIVLAGGLLVAAQMDRGVALFDAVRTVAYSFPVLFLALFMFTEPLTLPARRREQYVVAAAMGLVMAGPQFLSTFVDLNVPALLRRWETVVVIGNLVAFGLARRVGTELRLVRAREVTPTTREFVFRSRRGLRWGPGQYVELHVPHHGVDLRGTRRMLSIASAPDDGEVRLAMKMPDPCSSFKRALAELPEGSAVHATGVWGDFTLPADVSKPLVLVAGGIGITPFAAQAAQLRDRDAVLVYGAPSADEAPYLEEFAGVHGVLVCPEAPDHLPEGWTHVAAAAPTAAVLAEAVPDLDARHALVSGPPVMVSAVRSALFGPRWTFGLRRRVRSMRTDAFAGY